jgi:FkbM family methyltransferase
MRDFLRRVPLAREVYWGTKRLLKIPPRNHYDTLIALRAEQQRRSPSSPNTFEFPWGALEFTNFTVMAAQFEQIFVARHYAFRSDADAPVIVDCGGNIGLSAIWFRQEYPTCQLAVYEPDPEQFRLLQQNVGRAGISDVVLRQEAAWIANETVNFDCRGDDIGRIDRAGDTRVSAVDLAKALPERTDLLKLDIEGAEFTVLTHLCDTGAIARVRHLVCEFHVTREAVDGFLVLLRRLRESGMELAMGAELCSWTDAAPRTSPFELVGRHNMHVLAYAWMRDTTRDTTSAAT